MVKNGLVILFAYAFLCGVNKLVFKDELGWPYLAVSSIPLAWFVLRAAAVRTRRSNRKFMRYSIDHELAVYLVAPILALVVIAAIGLESICLRALAGADGKGFDGLYAGTVALLTFGVGPGLFHLLPVYREPAKPLETDFFSVE